MLTLVDNFSRISPAIEVDFSLTGKRVVEVLERLKLNYGLPKTIKLIMAASSSRRQWTSWRIVTM